MNEEAAHNVPLISFARIPHHWDSPHLRRWSLLLLISGMVVACIMVGPSLLWAYHLERAGHFMAVGLMWSEPRQVDDLPQLHSASALHSALAQLNAATYWRPNIAYTYRLLGQSYAALGDWARAAQAFEQAKTLAPSNPLAQWEAGLVYEQMWHAITQAPSDGLVGTLAQGQLQLPPTFGRATICGERARNCPIGQSIVVQPYAGFNENSSKVRFLLLSPPARVSYSLLIPPERPALRFLLGRDPSVAVGPASAATYHVWIETRGGVPKEVYTQQVEGNTLKGGWVGDGVNVGSWAGQVVTLTLGITLDTVSTPTPPGYGWGDIALTTTEAARFAAAMPEARARAAWQMAGFDIPRLLANGDAAFQQANYAKAFAWYKRILAMQQAVPYDLLFRSTISASLARRPEASALQDRLGILDPTFEVYPLKDEVSIQGAKLRWLTPVSSNITYGTPLTWGTGPTNKFAYFWGTGQGVVMLSVERAGRYLVAMRVQHGMPPPVEMAMGVDGQQIRQVSLQRGDDSWETITMLVNLESGLHTINIWFLNDGFVGGRDRNAVLDLVAISKDRS